MIATSQNGWKAAERAELSIVTVTVPGTKTKLPVLGGDVATVLLWVATRWHNEVEPLVEPGNWGYAYRSVRGATSGLSNHASGTAIDLNAPKHPLGTDPSQTMTKAQVSAAKRIEADSGGVVRWGGSYTGRKDSMHWEITAPTARVAALAARIRGGNPKPTPAPLNPGDPDMRIAVTPESTCWILRELSVVATGNMGEVSSLAKAYGVPITPMTREEVQECINSAARAYAALVAGISKAMPVPDIDEKALAAELLAAAPDLLSSAPQLTEEDIQRLLDDSEIDTVNLLAARLSQRVGA